MARKRGGAAGVWDRNKGWLKSVVPGVLGAIPGVGVPLAVAAGAAMRGFDREGKGGIGFDVGQGIRGGLEGYGMGKLGQSARVNIGKMLAPKMPAGALNMDVINADIARGMGGGAPASASSALPSVAAPDTIGMTNTMMPGQSATRFATPTAAGSPAAGAPAVGAYAKKTAGAANTKAPGLLSRTGTRATKAMDFANKYEKPLGAMIRGTGMVPNPEAEALAAKNEIEQDKLEFERQQYADMQKQQMRIAQLLAPMYQQMMGARGMGSTTGVIAQPPSAFLANSGPTSLSNYVDLSGANNPRPVPLSRGTELGNYLNDIGMLDEEQDSVPSGVRYAQAYRPASPAPMSRRSRGGYVRYD